MTHLSIKGSLYVKGNQDGIIHADRSLTVKRDGKTVLDLKPQTPKLTDTQKQALRLCWLADRNPRHPDLVMPGSMGNLSYSDSEGHVRTGCALTRSNTIDVLKRHNLVKLADDFAVHITEAGRFAADVYGFTD